MLFLLLLQPFYAFSQYSGTYSIGNGLSGKDITLLPQNKFLYRYGDCDKSYEGEGWYKIGQKLLILHFKKDTMCPDKTKVDSVVLPNQNSNFSKLDFSILDAKTQDPILQANIRLSLDTAKYITMVQGTVTDRNGHATLQYPSQKAKGYIRISSLTYRTIIIPINMGNDYKIEVLMTDWCKSVPAGKIYKLKIKRTKEDFELITRKGERFYKEK